MYYIKLFKTHSEYEEYINGEDVVLSNVSFCKNERDVHYNPYDYSRAYLSFVATSGGDVTWTGTENNALSYSTDDGETWSEPSVNITLQVNEGDKILWKGVTTPGTSSTNQGIGKFSGGTDVRYTIEGNVMSLLFGDDFKGQTSLEGKNYALYNLFNGNTNVTSADNLSLPATTLADYCYVAMFQRCTNLTTPPSVLPAAELATYCYAHMFVNCTSLTTAPELPATTLAENCYQSMFYGCRSLTTAPELPATELANECYLVMFRGCTRLTTAPELPATTLAQNCYNNMFIDCTSLTTAPSVLPATTLAQGCYNQMFKGCTRLTTAPELPATTLADDCYGFMFEDCSSLTTAPSVLPATTLERVCYRNMFQGCTRLTTAPELPATTLAYGCYDGMFINCTSLTTAPELPATTLTTFCYGYMFQGCTNLSSIKCLATTLANSSTTDWVSGVATSGTFTKDASMTSWTRDDNGIPSGWTVVNA